MYRRHEILQEELRDELTPIIPVVWLPVNRRTEVSRDDSDLGRRGERVETIDQNLSQLLSRLQRYRLRLETQISKRYKEFERQVLALLLYDKDVDTYGDGAGGVSTVSLTEEDADQLTKSFKDADLFDAGMQKKSKKHFSRATKAVDVLSKVSGGSIPIDEILLLPLIKRTKSIIEFARTLESDLSLIHI